MNSKSVDICPSRVTIVSINVNNQGDLEKLGFDQLQQNCEGQNGSKLRKTVEENVHKERVDTYFYLDVYYTNRTMRHPGKADRPQHITGILKIRHFNHEL